MDRSYLTVGADGSLAAMAHRPFCPDGTWIVPIVGVRESKSFFYSDPAEPLPEWVVCPAFAKRNRFADALIAL